MDRTKKVLHIKNVFDKLYGDATCSLNYKTPFELLVATILAAQCTDARVNIVTKDLFKKYKTIDDFANANLEELMEDIRPTGFFRNKAKNIIGTAKMILSDFGGKVPSNREDLLKLPGVGRKTANLILGDIYNIPALVIDTHAKRITNRLGLTKETDPAKIEFDLDDVVPKEYQAKFCHQLVFFGRDICDARKPKCGICPVSDVCEYYKKSKKDKKSAS